MTGEDYFNTQMGLIIKSPNSHYCLQVAEATHYASGYNNNWEQEKRKLLRKLLWRKLIINRLLFTVSFLFCAVIVLFLLVLAVVAIQDEIAGYLYGFSAGELLLLIWIVLANAFNISREDIYSVRHRNKIYETCDFQ